MEHSFIKPDVCPNCGVKLIAKSSNRCPQCGFDLTKVKWRLRYAKQKG